MKPKPTFNYVPIKSSENNSDPDGSNKFEMVNNIMKNTVLKQIQFNHFSNYIISGF